MSPTHSSLHAPIIGYDPGFGNTKVCVGGQIGLVPSHISIPRNIGMAAIGLKSAGRHATLVSFNGHEYAVGAGATAKGALRTSMDFSSLVSPERMALLYAALAQVQNGPLGDAMLVVGLPVPLLEDLQQAQTVMGQLKGLKTTHEYSVGGQAVQFSIARLKVLAQPAGAYLDYAYDDDLQARAGVSRCEVLVVDIGMNTLDVYVLKNGQVLESFVGGAEVGVRRLLERVATNGHDVMELDEALRSGGLKFDSADLDGYLHEILAALKRIAANLKRFDVVIPCGGGSVVLGDRLRYALTAKGAAVHWPEDPVTANVRGLYKYGMKNAA